MSSLEGSITLQAFGAALFLFLFFFFFFPFPLSLLMLSQKFAGKIQAGISTHLCQE